MNWYLEVLKKYAIFNGRSRRSEYWYFVLYNVLFSVIALLIDVVTGTYDRAIGLGLVGGIYSLGVLIPSLAVTVRRLHDTDRSGWWLLVGLIPILGWIVLLVYYVQDGSPDNNRYGANPKNASI
jgi:uncharacterized membrane protein YhaH (DUF805 family)